MSTKKKILGVDFDDVVFDNNGSIAEFHNLHYGTSYGREDNTRYLFEYVWNVPTEEVDRRMQHYYETDFHHEAPIVAGAKEALTALKEDFEIILITARGEKRCAVTEAWLVKNLPGLIERTYFTDHFLFDAPDTRLRKSDLCRDLGVSYLVEDAPHQAADVAKSAPDTEVLLFDCPWNRAETPPGARRVYSWEEIVSLLMHRS